MASARSSRTPVAYGIVIVGIGKMPEGVRCISVCYVLVFAVAVRPVSPVIPARTTRMGRPTIAEATIPICARAGVTRTAETGLRLGGAIQNEVTNVGLATALLPYRMDSRRRSCEIAAGHQRDGRVLTCVVPADSEMRRPESQVLEDSPRIDSPVTHGG